MIYDFAQFYVNFLEPAFQILLIILVVIFLLYILNVLRGGAAKGDALSAVVNGVVKLLLKTVQLIGKSILHMLASVFRTLRLLFATMRDFLFSKDL